MKKNFGIITILAFVAMLFGAVYALENQDDFDDILEDLILINYHLSKTTEKSVQKQLEISKNRELNKLNLQLFINQQLKISDLIKEQNALKQDLLKKDKINSDDLIKIESLEIQKIMQEFIQNLKNTKDLKSLIDSTKLAILAVPDFNNLQSDEAKKYKALKQSFIDVLNFLAQEAQAQEPSAQQKEQIGEKGQIAEKGEKYYAFFDFGSEHILSIVEKGVIYTGITTNTRLISKIILSLIIIFGLFTIRKLLAEGIFLLINFVMRLGIQDKISHQKIRSDMTAPLTFGLLFVGLNIDVAILSQPNDINSGWIKLFGLLYIFSISWLLITILKSYGAVLMDKFLAQKHGFRREVVNLILKIGYFVVFVIGLLVALSFLGFNIQTIVASLGIGGLAVALALKDMLANFFASVMLLFENSFSQGDWIVCSGVEGTVVEMGLRRTLVRTFDNALVFVPNQMLANASVLNWNRRKVGRRIKMLVGLTYSTSVKDMEKCINDIRNMLFNHPDISKSDQSDEIDENIDSYEIALKKNIISMNDLLGYKYNLFVVLDSFGDSSINILIYCFSRSVVWGEFLAIKQDVMLKIMQIVEDNKLSFAFPSQSLYVETLPENLNDLIAQNTKNKNKNKINAK
ncbi:MAG: mechanosensitive ion channel [Helicobacter sp.]|mgnify:CR=1 FL=1|nr:mechanosensitive ion channel [Helicobacter sp.]